MACGGRWPAAPPPGADCCRVRSGSAGRYAVKMLLNGAVRKVLVPGRPPVIYRSTRMPIISELNCNSECPPPSGRC